MDIITIALVMAVTINLFLTVWLLVSNRKTGTTDINSSIETNLSHLKADIVSKQMEGMLSMRESLDNSHKLLNETLSQGTTSIDRRMAVINEIENKLGELTKQTSNIEKIGGNIQSLSELLKPPKLRGNLGELLLENLIKQILPASLYETQHKFRNGQRVDVVVMIGDKLLPVDSKFPIETYQKTVNDNGDFKALSIGLKKYIDDISSKYIIPQENTTDFALMYIPAEAAYTEFISNEDTSLFEYALSRKVIPSSPGHLYGFLASISQMFMDSALVKNKRQLLDAFNDIYESMNKLINLNERLNGSLRSAVTSNEKVRNEIIKVKTTLDDLKEPIMENKIN